MLYQWFRALHLITMVVWFAGLLSIFRVFWLHLQHRQHAQVAESYAALERKILYAISHPAMGLTLLFGIGMVVLNPNLFAQGWFHGKLTALILLMAFQIHAGRVHKRLVKGDDFLSEQRCRVMSLVPVVLLVVMVLLAVLKP